jgi:hypothetical protein
MLRLSLSTRWLAALPLVLLLAIPSFAAVRSQGGAAPSAAKTPVPQQPAPQNENASPVLPEVFAGWQMTGSPQISTDPKAADDGDAGVLQEYGFQRYLSATYTRNDGTLDIKAIQFADATGAYGAFTFYRQPNMASEPIGRGAAFDGQRVLFWSGDVLVDATFSKPSAMTADELRDLASQLPKPAGSSGALPTLPEYLPGKHLQAGTVRYAIGPEAYRLRGGLLPPELVDFGKSAETVTAQYNALRGEGVLTIINYPTPEIAIGREKAIRAYFNSLRSGKQSASGDAFPTTAISDSNPAAIQVRRSGPLVAVTSGDFSQGAAKNLLQHVYYVADVSNGTGMASAPDTVKLAQLIISVAIIVGIFALIAIVAGLSLGGGRAMWRKMRRESGAKYDESAEFIRLNLRE